MNWGDQGFNLKQLVVLISRNCCAT